MMLSSRSVKKSIFTGPLSSSANFSRITSWSLRGIMLLLLTAGSNPDENQALGGGGAGEDGQDPEHRSHLINYKAEAQEHHPLGAGEQAFAQVEADDLGAGADIADEDGAHAGGEGEKLLGAATAA